VSARAILHGVMASLDSFVPFSAGRILEEARKHAPDLLVRDVHPPLQDVANAIHDLRMRVSNAESAKQSAEFRFGEALKSRDRTKARLHAAHAALDEAGVPRMWDDVTLTHEEPMPLEKRIKHLALERDAARGGS